MNPNPPQAHDPEPPRSEFLSVREAANALGVHARKIYRMDRAHGPFTILKWGWKVLVERDSFDRYVRSLGPKDHSGKPEECAPAPDYERPKIAHVVSKATGQRELFVPARRPFVVIYMA